MNILIQRVIFMRICKNLLYFIIAVFLIGLGIGIFLGKIFSFFIFAIAIGSIALGVYLIIAS